MNDILEKIRNTFTLKNIYTDVDPLDVLLSDFLNEIRDLGVILKRVDEKDLVSLTEEWKGTLLITSRQTDVAFFEGMVHRPAIIGYGDTITSGVEMIVEGFEEVDYQFLDRMEKRAHGLPWTIGYTNRCVIREITLEDMDDLFDMYSSPHFTDYLEPLFERKKEEEYTRNYINNIYRIYGYGMWVIRDIETGDFIGRAGFGFRRIDGAEDDCIDLGYAISSKYQRQGYAYEVCSKIIEIARDNLELPELNCFIYPGNTASANLIEKLGFTYIGNIVEDGNILKRYSISFEAI